MASPRPVRQPQNVFVRAIALLVLCAVLFTGVWVGSYLFLPEDLLRGTPLAYLAPIETDRAATTFSRIYA